MLTSEAANLNFGFKMCEYTGFQSFRDSSNLPIINFYVKTPVLIILNIKNDLKRLTRNRRLLEAGFQGCTVKYHVTYHLWGF